MNAVTPYGFIFGAATVVRWAEDEDNGWAFIGLITPKHPDGLQIHVTKSGRVRIYGQHGEWKEQKQIKS